MTAPSCARCAEKYAGDPAALGTSPILDAALDAGALAAGWQQDGDAWTCTVCQAKAAPQPALPAAPQPALPAAPPQGEHEAPPDTDPYDQYVSMSAELDADLRGWWAATNRATAPRTSSPVRGQAMSRTTSRACPLRCRAGILARRAAPGVRPA